MVVDAHAHACGGFLEAGRIVDSLDAAGVDKLVLVPGEPNSTKTYSLPPLARAFPKRNVVTLTNALTRAAIAASGAWRHIQSGNAFVQSIVRQLPDRVLQFYWVSASCPNTMEQMDAHYREWKFHGVKVHQCWESFQIDSDFFRTVARFATDRNMPLFIHLSSRREALSLAEFVNDHRDLCLIVGHLFALEPFISANQNCRNVFFDISPYSLISDYRIRLALEHYGSAQLVFGSDTPYGKDSLAKGIGRIRSLEISEEEKQRILGNNVARLLKLDCA